MNTLSKHVRNLRRKTVRTTRTTVSLEVTLYDGEGNPDGLANDSGPIRTKVKQTTTEEWFE